MEGPDFLKNFSFLEGGIIRGDSTKKELAIVFTADEFGEGLPVIFKTLKQENVKAGFFFTGRFFRNIQFKESIKKLQQGGHYIGPHSNDHLLYNDWKKRDSLLVSKDSFVTDISQNIEAMAAAGLPIYSPHLFIPPYEWWNDSISYWSQQQNLALFSFTPGIRTNADYTWPELGSAYKSSEWIINQLNELIYSKPTALNGAIILIHAGTDPRRKHKLYDRLGELIQLLKKGGYQLLRIDNLLKN